MTHASPIFLGIDTGGTYTDAVLWSETDGRLLAKAKALTTRHDLTVGIGGAVDAVLAQSGVAAAEVKLVSLSTTLATNALVEGQGGRAALVMIGFSEHELARDGLRAAIGGDPVILCPGGHDVHGNPSQLDLQPLQRALTELAQTVSAFAVCGHFATRNPGHELAAAELIRARTGLPVTCSHELTSKLGGPRRALTTLLNARLVPMIERLIAATGQDLTARGSDAPLMVVRGDGALVSADFARSRPIETILSGPAASIVGARHLTGLDNAVVSDIGGTTTDVAVLDRGRPRLDPEGATVGGYRTMVEAVAMRTFGLGGDSEVALEDGALEPRILLGPRRLMPLSLAAHLHGEAALEPLRRQLLTANAARLDGRLAMRSGLPGPAAAALTETEARLFAALGDAPVALDRLFTASAQQASLGRLVARGLVIISGFTPSDAAHVLGRQANWNAEAAQLGAELMARRRDGRGQLIAASPGAFAQVVLDSLSRASARVIFETAFAEDGRNGVDAAQDEIIALALAGRQGIARVSLSLDRPVIGLGAPAGLHYAGLHRLVGADCLVPDHADVANALGAVVGQVRVRVDAHVGQPQPGLFTLNAGVAQASFADEAQALAAAERAVGQQVSELAAKAGAAEFSIGLSRQIRTATVEGQRSFIEAVITATATGRPRIAAG